MTKYNTKSVILRAVATSPILTGKESLGVVKNRLKINTKSENIKNKEKRVGSIKTHSEDGLNVLASDKKSIVVEVDGNISEEQTQEGTFNIYMDIFTAEGTVSNKRLETLLAADVTLSEIKVLENGWGGSNSTFLEGARIAAKNYSPSSTVKEYSERVLYYDVVKSIQISDIIPNSDMYGDLLLGIGADISVDSEHTSLQTNFLLKQVNDVYVNKIPGISNSAWLNLVNNL